MIDFNSNHCARRAGCTQHPSSATRDEKSDTNIGMHVYVWTPLQRHLFWRILVTTTDDQQSVAAHAHMPRKCGRRHRTKQKNLTYKHKLKLLADSNSCGIMGCTAPCHTHVFNAPANVHLHMFLPHLKAYAAACTLYTWVTAVNPP